MFKLIQLISKQTQMQTHIYTYTYIFAQYRRDIFMLKVIFLLSCSTRCSQYYQSFTLCSWQSRIFCVRFHPRRYSGPSYLLVFLMHNKRKLFLKYLFSRWIRIYRCLGNVQLGNCKNQISVQFLIYFSCQVVFLKCFTDDLITDF